MFYWENMSHQCHTRFCHYVTFWFRGYLTSVLCHVLLKRRYVNLTCVYYCLIIKELNAKEFTAHTILQLRLQVVCYLCWSVYVFKVILMSTHKICFYGELTKIILQLSSDTLLICSSVEVRSQGSWLWSSVCGFRSAGGMILSNQNRTVLLRGHDHLHHLLEASSWLSG